MLARGVTILPIYGVVHTLVFVLYFGVGAFRNTDDPQSVVSLNA